MEELSDDDVKEFASDWVRRLQNSVLAADNDVSNPGVVRSRFGSDDERILPKDEFREEIDEVDRSNFRWRPSFAVDLRNSVADKHLPGRGEGDEEQVLSFECSSKHSNVDQDHQRFGGKSTPRPDSEFLRQKRLAFFSNSLELHETKKLNVPRDENRNIPKQFPVSLSSTCGHETHSSRSEHFDSYPLKGKSHVKQEISNKMHQLDSFETPFLSGFSSGISQSANTDSVHLYQNMSPRRFYSDEEEIRLELWGLKEAVHSGKLDLNAYLHKPLWKDQFFPASSGQLVNSYEQNHCKQQFVRSPPKDTYSSLHIERTLNGKASINCTEFNGPEPQINGPLYSGFENSDSETSLLSFGSKCDDVHYRKVIKKQESSVTNEKMSTRVKDPVGKKQGHKMKQKRGKDKILMELTEFIEGCGNPKNIDHSKQNGSIINDWHSQDVPSKITKDNREAVSMDHIQNEDVRGGDFISGIKNPLDKACISNSNTALSYNHTHPNDTLVVPAEESGNVMGKVCPKCDEVNSKAANWCIECGTALICVKATCLTPQQRKVFEKQCEETQALIKETLNKPMNFSHLLGYDKAEQEERSLSNDISNLSLQVSQSTSNLEEMRYSSSSREYKRRWMRSSTAWSTYHPCELTKSRSFVKDQTKTKQRQRATSFSDLTSSAKEKGSKHQKRSGRNKSRKRTTSYSGAEKDAMNSSDGFTNLKSFGQNRNYSSMNTTRNEKQNQSSVVQRASLPIENMPENNISAEGLHGENVPNGMVHSKGYPSQCMIQGSTASSFDEGATPSKSVVSKTVVPPLNLQEVGSYERILTLIRSQRESEPVPYLYLPDEILLQIFSFLSHKDLASCARVCSQFYRISLDETLWKVIVLKKNNNINDEWLCSVGKHRPTSLTISQCHSDKVTSKGLRELFRNCSDSLEELNFSSCRGSELIGESVLLHVAARCCWLKSVDASWSNVSDNGVQALVDNVKRLECLCLNGCQAVSDESIKCVANKHGETLRIFEVFGCFNITPSGIRILGQTCKQLQTLNIGQCHKITDSAIGSLVSNLPELENLDLRGCKQVRDSAVKKIVRHCPLVTTLVLANCPLITDVSLTEIATNLPRIRSLDICGCSRISDNGICALSKSCQRLELLDLTSTGVGHKSVLSLANYCSQSLCNLKLSFCTDISQNTVAHLAKNCRRLTTLHLYGCKRIRNTSDLRLLNPALTIEC